MSTGSANHGRHLPSFALPRVWRGNEIRGSNLARLKCAENSATSFYFSKIKIEGKWMINFCPELNDSSEWGYLKILKRELVSKKVSFVPCCKVLNVWKIIWGNFKDFVKILTIEMILIRIFWYWKFYSFFFLIKFKREMINRAEFCILQDNDPQNTKKKFNELTITCHSLFVWIFNI